MKVRQLYSGSRTSGYVIEDKWFLKVYHDTRIIKGFDNLFLRAKPENEYFFSRFLLKSGIPTTEAVSYRVVKRFGFLPLNVGFVKFKYLKGLTPIDKLLNSENFANLFLRALDVAAALHEISVRHGDLAVSNFGVFSGKVYIFDLGSAKRVFHPYFAHRETFRLLHDLYKFCKREGLNFDFRELFNYYLSEISMRSFLKRKLEKDFVEYARERGMVRE